MRRTAIIMLLLAHCTLVPLGCSWWNAKGKAEAVTALHCAETAVSSQVAVLISQLAAGDYAALTIIGEDVLACALAAVVQLPTAPRGKTQPAMALRMELDLRRAKARK